MGKSKQNKRKERPSSSGDDSLPLADIKNKNIDSKRRKEEESKMAECGVGDMNKETLLSTIKEITSDLMKQMDIKLESLSSKDDINKLRCDVNKAFESFKQRVEVAEKDIFDIKEDQAEVKTKIAGIERENKEVTHLIEEGKDTKASEKTLAPEIDTTTKFEFISSESDASTAICCFLARTVHSLRT